jgi:hypothetical protein
MNQIARPWYPGFRLLLLAAAFAAFGAAADGEVAGVFKRVEGKVTVTHGGSSQPAQVGMPVYQADSVATGPDGGAGITFEDNSLLSLGPSASLSIDHFSFDTTTYDGAFELTLTKGRLAVVSGKVAKHKQDAMKVRTPSSILGVRGTEFVVEVGGDTP